MREYSPYAVTQLRGLLVAHRRLEKEIKRLEKEKALLISEGRAIGFTWTMVKSCIRALRGREIPRSDDELVTLYRRLAQELDGPRRQVVLSRSAPVDADGETDGTGR